MRTIAERKMRKVMSEFKHGSLHASAGYSVKDKKQALAIAYSEAREAAKRKRKKR